MYILIVNYTMLSKYGYCTHLLKIKNKLKIGCLYKKVGKNSPYFVGVFNKTIILLVLVGYEIIIANSYKTRTRGIIVKYPEFAEEQTNEHGNLTSIEVSMP